LRARRGTLKNNWTVFELAIYPRRIAAVIDQRAFGKSAIDERGIVENDGRAFFVEVFEYLHHLKHRLDEFYGSNLPLNRSFADLKISQQLCERPIPCGFGWGFPRFLSRARKLFTDVSAGVAFWATAIALFHGCNLSLFVSLGRLSRITSFHHMAGACGLAFFIYTNSGCGTIRRSALHAPSH
jgi:hypothetical protein